MTPRKKPATFFFLLCPPRTLTGLQTRMAGQIKSKLHRSQDTSQRTTARGHADVSRAVVHSLDTGQHTMSDVITNTDGLIHECHTSTAAISNKGPYHLTMEAWTRNGKTSGCHSNALEVWMHCNARRQEATQKSSEQSHDPSYTGRTPDNIQSLT